MCGYRPHKGQRLVHKSSARHRVVDAGRRLGKSVLGGHELVAEAISTYHQRDSWKAEGLRREFWIVGPEYSDSEKEFRVLWNKLDGLGLKENFDKPGSYNNPEAGQLSLSMFKGVFQVHGKSAKYPSTLVGEGLSGVVMAEAAKLKEIVWVKYIRPTLADFKGWSIHSSTPEGRNWFYESWRRGQDPNDVEWESWKMPSWYNDTVFPMGGTYEGVEMLHKAIREGHSLTPALIAASGLDTEIVDMLRDMTEERFNQEVGADFTEYVGRVFKTFDEERHVTDLDYDPAYPVFACCDYGWTNPFVWLVVQVVAWDEVHVLAEYRAVRKDINDIADDLAAFPITGQIRTLYPDPAEPGDTAILEKKLKVVGNTSTGGELKWRLELIRQALKFGPQHAPFEEQRSKLYIDRSCVELIREMGDYRYPDTKEEQNKENPEKPLDKDDHGPEALGRFFRGYYGAPEDPHEGKVRVTKARVSR